VRSRRGRVVVAAVALVALLGGATAIGIERMLLPKPDDDVLTFLLLGSDEGPMRSANPLRGRADGIQLLFVSGDRRHATFVSIPRDSYIPVPGRGTTRINACLVDGPERCVTAVENEFGVDVDAYLLTSMHAFARAIRAFGGLTVDVPTPVSDGGHPIRKAGEQHLTGMQSLAYARDRKNRPGGDFARSQAQAELLAIAHSKVHDDADVRAVLDAVEILRRHTVTDLTGPEMVHFAFQALRLQPRRVQRELAPAQHGRAGAASIVRLRPRAYELIRDAADDGRVG
jgi:polyisoprenyl-teichoic acid--peptidoglycan teichoic acid transferase